MDDGWDRRRRPRNRGEQHYGPSSGEFDHPKGAYRVHTSGHYLLLGRREVDTWARCREDIGITRCPPSSFPFPHLTQKAGTEILLRTVPPAGGPTQPISGQP